MASKHKSRARNEVIRCPNCGEDYSVTYKCCPFCDNDATSRTGRRGGKRQNNTRGGGYGNGWGPLRILATILSLALIIAAGYIVFTIVKPLVDLGSEEPETVITATPSSTTPPTSEATPEPTGEATPEATPTPTATPTPSSVTAQSFTLNASDFTLQSPGETYRIRATFSPAGTTGTISWTSSNPSIVHVAGDGTVTGLAGGNSTITATMENGYTQTCIVRCGWSSGSTYPTPGSGTTTASPSQGTTALTINRTDITLSHAGETFTLKVSGTDSTPTWTSNNTSVATVSAGGKVTAASSGSTTIKAKVDGQTLECIIRCSF